MASNEIEVALEDLSIGLNIPKLTLDHNQTCLLILDDISIQLESDNDARYLLIGTDFGEIPSGRYHEDLFEAALKTNALPPPLYGILAFSKKNNHFVLFDRLWLSELNPYKLADHLRAFAKKASIWKEAIEQNRVPVIDEIHPSSQISIFGIRP